MMCKCGVKLSISVVIVSSLILLVTSFNVDIYDYVQHQGKQDSMFGFSIATHKEHGRSWVIVGAPTSRGQQSRIQRGGAVFKCSTSSDNGCEEVDFHQERSGGNTPDDKDNQWFGATVSSAGPDGPVVACAPRYVWFTTSREERRDPVGTCYIARDDFRKFSEYSPCRTSLFGYHRQGSCQAGFSAGISKDGKRLFVGAPGSWYWQGQMYSIDPMIKFPYTPGIFGEAFGFGTKGQVIQQSLDDRPAVMSTPEGPATDDNSYMGYSMVVGDFNGDGVQGLAVGMPRGGDSLEGKVLLYTWSLTNYLNLTGEQLGSYFGYAVAASDIDGDGRDDVIIGAPLHAEPNNEMKYEVGRVYIAYQGLNGSYATRGFLDGIRSKSRFGLSLSTLGDLNLDSYGDFAVGAPYGGPNGRGAVYIFQGSKNGVIEKYSQVIYAEDVQGSFGSFYPLSTFGFSIAGGLDLDGNDYPDLAIGAYLSDTAYFFRARPVVKVEASVRFTERVIRLDHKTCEKPDDRSVRVACAGIQVCMRYNGIGAPPRIDMFLQFILDAKLPTQSRMYLNRGTGKVVNATITLYKDAPLNCDLRDMVYLDESIVDKLTDLEISVNYTLRDSWIHHQPYERDPRSVLKPIIDLSKPAIVNDTISIFKNCGPDNVCIPDLHLKVEKRVNKYLHEAEKPLEFDIEVTNTEDDAYNTKFYVQLPKGIVFTVAYIIDNIQSEKNKLSCTRTFNVSTWVCDIGNPLLKNTGVHFKLKVEPARDQKLLKPTYDFYMNVTSANPEDSFTLFDNSAEISIDIWVEALLTTEGKSSPTNVYYNISQYKTVQEANWDSEIGPPVIHSYAVTNKGPSDVQEVEIYIIWPLLTGGVKGEDLLYLIEAPHTIGDVKCHPIDVNYREFSLALQRNVWDMINVYKGTDPAGETGAIGTQTERPTPGKTADSITYTVTVLTFYDLDNRPLTQIQVTGEPGSPEYWRNVSITAMQFPGASTVQGNSSSLTIDYFQGKEISRRVVNRPPGPGEMPFMSFRINSNVTTTVTYYGLAGNIVYQEHIIEPPGMLTYKDRIKRTKANLNEPVTYRRNTTWHYEYITSDGKYRYNNIITQTGSDVATNAEISFTNVNTIVKFVGLDNKVLLQETVEGEANSLEFWKYINKIISGFRVPVTVHTKTIKVITYVMNGNITRKEEIPVRPTAPQVPLTTHTTMTTTIKITNLRGKVLHESNIPGEKGSKDYEQYLNNILGRLKEPVILETKTVYTIIYRSSNGQMIQRGTYTETRTEQYVPSQIETNRTHTITTVTVYDIHGNIVHEANITDAVGSAEYWNKINEISSRYQERQVSIRINTRTIITYYVNEKEIRSKPDGPETHESYKPQTVVTTTVTVYNSKGTVLERETVDGKIDSINHIINKYNEPIKIEIKTVYVITYQGSDGQIIRRETYTETRTETHIPSPKETSRTITITTVTFYDVNGNIIQQETVREPVGSVEYWKKINEISSRYQQQQVSIRITTKTIIMYYVNGVEVRSEPIGTGTHEESYRPQTVVTTTVTVYSSSGTILEQETIDGKIESISHIISKYNEPITVEIKTIYTITYYGSDGQITRRETYTETRTETHTHTPRPSETSRMTTITTVTFYDGNGNRIYQEDIRDEPESAAYWKIIDKIISRHHQYRQQITMDVSTKTIITYYINNQPVRTEQVDGGISGRQKSLRPQIGITTTITVYNSNREVLYEGPIPGEKGTFEYDTHINNIVSRFRQPLTIVTKITYTIQYYDSSATVIHTGSDFKEETQSYNQHQQHQETSQTRTITTIIIYGPNGNILRRETIADEPRSAVYWEHIKNAISDFSFPVNIHTNSSKVITYYANGIETRNEHVPGITQIPFTTHIDILNIITYYDDNRNVLTQERVTGDMSAEERSRRIADFTKRYGRSFTMETNTTKTITYRTSDGQVLHSEGILVLRPANPSEQHLTRTVTETTFTVYGPDGTHVIHRETIQGEPGSTAYNNAVANIISKFTGSITIYTNSTKTITFYTADGRTLLNRESLPEPRSTVQRQGAASHANAITTVTFYGPDGQTIHEGTINGAPGSDLYEQLDKIAKGYGGVVKSYGGQLNTDGSIGGSVTLVDTPYPGNRPTSTGQHFTEFGATHGQGQSRWSSGINQSYQHDEGKQARAHDYGTDSSNQRFNLQDLNVNQQEHGLGSFAKGKGFRAGGVDLGITNTGSVDHSVDGKARKSFGTLSYDGSHNYLSSGQTYHNDNSQSRPDSRGYHDRSKREVDTTDSDIKKLENCTTSKCITIRCTTGPMRKHDEVHIAIRARVVVQTLKNISTTQPVNIQSMMLARISHFQEISGSPAQRKLYRQQVVTSVMAPQPDIKSDIVPLWVVILSAVAGTLILLLLIFLLHKCGFFKRNRPSDAPERQPLNRNGHFQHGDEAL